MGVVRMRNETREAGLGHIGKWLEKAHRHA